MKPTIKELKKEIKGLKKQIEILHKSLNRLTAVLSTRTGNQNPPSSPFRDPFRHPPPRITRIIRSPTGTPFFDDIFRMLEEEPRIRFGAEIPEIEELQKEYSIKYYKALVELMFRKKLLPKANYNKIKKIISKTK